MIRSPNSGNRYPSRPPDGTTRSKPWGQAPGSPSTEARSSGPVPLPPSRTGATQVSRPCRFIGIAGFAAGGNGIWALTDGGLLSRFDTVSLKTDEKLQLPETTNKGFSPWTSALDDATTSTIWVAD
jgi:hypothetical protein